VDAESCKPRDAGGRRATAQFLLSGVVVLVLLGVAAVALVRHNGRREAERDAVRLTQLISEGIVAEQVDDAVLRGDPAALRRLDAIARRGILGHDVERLKLWDASGRILWSDQRRLIGRRFTLNAGELRALRRGDSVAQVSRLDAEENRDEGLRAPALEVYQGFRARNGQPLLLESYQRLSAVTADAGRLVGIFAPALVAALVLLQAAQLPLVRSLVRRLERGQREREALLQRALDAADGERARIARDLHDGTVQDLAGVSYGISAAADALRDRDPALAADLDAAATGTRRSLRELRSLLVDLYPPDLRREGLAAALHDLAAPLAARGIAASVRVPDGLEVDERTEHLLFRMAREGLRNVMKHAGASRVDLSVARTGDAVALVIADDGHGPGSAKDRARGHVGLRVLEDLSRDAGGRCALTARPGGGALLLCEVRAS
jgi:signal transduction histidine kinase